MPVIEKNQTMNGIDLAILENTVAAVKQDPARAKCKFRARNRWQGGTQNETTISDFFGAKQEMTHEQEFSLQADEPPILAGSDRAPNPVEHLLNALAGCVTTSLVAHAAVRGIRIEAIESKLEGDIDLRGFLGLDQNIPKGFTDIRINFKVKSANASPEQLRALAEFSPVYNTLTQGCRVNVAITA